MIKKIGSILMASLLTVALATGCGKKTVDKKKSEISVSTMKEMPSIEGTSLGTDKKIDNSILKENKYLLINVWSSGCGACVEELNTLEKLSKEYKTKGLKILGVVANGDIEKTDSYNLIKEKNITYENLIPSEKFMNDFVNKEKAIPYSVIVDNTGKIKKFILGALPYEEFNKIIKEEIK